MKVNDLQGEILNYYTARACDKLSKDGKLYYDGFEWQWLINMDYNFIMPYVEKYDIHIEKDYDTDEWIANDYDCSRKSYNKNLIDAIKKTIIKIKLGEEAEVLNEKMQT